MLRVAQRRISERAEKGTHHKPDNEVEESLLICLKFIHVNDSGSALQQFSALSCHVATTINQTFYLLILKNSAIDCSYLLILRMTIAIS